MRKIVTLVMIAASMVLAASLAYWEEEAKPALVRPRRVVKPAVRQNRAEPGVRPKVGEQVRENRVDRREANQERRIKHGIKKGYLTPDEVTKLEAEQKGIADLKAGFKADGKVSVDEMKQLRTALNTASVHIWSEKHDTDGKQMAAYRLGKNIFAKSEFTAHTAGDLTGTQAKQIAKDFHKMLALKRSLATQELTPEERAKQQAAYDELLNKYFEIRDPDAAKTTPSGAATGK